MKEHYTNPGKNCLWVYLLFLLSLTSCSESPEFEEIHKISSEGWAQNDPANFRIDISDTSGTYDLILKVGHTQDYPFQNIHLQTSTTFPADTTITAPLGFNLAAKNGVWFGKCGNDLCSLDVYLEEGVKFIQPGTYILTFEQYTRESILPGITQLSLVIKKTQT